MPLTLRGRIEHADMPNQPNQGLSSAGATGIEKGIT